MVRIFYNSKKINFLKFNSYLIALYGLYVFLIDFDKKVFKIKVTLKNIPFAQNLQKREVVTLVKL